MPPNSLSWIDCLSLEAVYEGYISGNITLIVYPVFSTFDLCSFGIGIISCTYSECTLCMRAEERKAMDVACISPTEPVRLIQYCRFCPYCRKRRMAYPSCGAYLKPNP